MQTRANILGHPVHMMLVHFPIAFLTGAFFFDVAGKMVDNPVLWEVGAYLLIIGLLAGVISAIPGIVDYLTSVPKSGNAAKNTIRHALVSVLSLAVFGVAWLIRDGTGIEPASLTLILEGIGTILISVAGFLGGSLVLKDLIGPHT